MTGSIRLGECVADRHDNCPTVAKLPHGFRLRCGCDCHE
jgi:hypothetical protein